MKDLSLSLKRGSFTSLVGESGSGKTVTALSVCGLLQPEKLSGRAIYQGDNGGETDLFLLGEPELRSVRGREIAYIFQNPASSFNPVMKVGSQVAEAYQAHFSCSKAQALEKAAEALEAAKLTDFPRVMRSYPHELSGGMKQRAMIAMALVSRPKLLIADEPTTALDASTEREIMDLLKGLNADRGLTVFFITHDLGLASRYSEEITVLKEGRLQEKMTKGPSGYEPRGDYAKKLFRAQILDLPPKSFIGID
ncbi:MAG: ABC transporter ATP-binding protein [Candidatus Omnitrophica bacterium]|nr:ABC transporter ATP-binding protein [Candidatus Omnitrophota bacterium]